MGASAGTVSFLGKILGLVVETILILCNPRVAALSHITEFLTNVLHEQGLGSSPLADARTRDPTCLIDSSWLGEIVASRARIKDPPRVPDRCRPVPPIW